MRRNAASVLLLVALLVPGCASPVGERDASREILRATVTLGPTTGLEKELAVDVPANATRLEVTVRYTGAGSGIAWSGPGECRGDAGLAIGQHNEATQRGSCAAPAAGRRTMSVSIEAGAAEAEIVIVASFR